MPGRIAIVAFALWTCVRASALADDPVASPPPYRVVIARVGANALVIFNATPSVADIVARHVPDADANARLEREALVALAAKLDQLGDARTIEERILYDKTGDVSPIYGGATFQGVERYAVVLIDAARARHQPRAFALLRSGDALPSYVTFRVVGSLPPR